MFRKILGIFMFLALVGLAGDPIDALPKIGKKKSGKCLPFNVTGTWQGYLHTEDGLDCGLPDPVEELKDRQWMALRFTDYQGPKPTVTVMEVDNRSGFQGVPLDGIESLLSATIFNTNRFVLVERLRVNRALAEQDFGASGRVSQPTAAAIGKVVGADYLIFASIVEWLPEKGKIGASGGKSRGWYRRNKIGASVNRSQAEVTMGFEIVDATTSTVLHSMTKRATAKSWGIGSSLFGKIGGAFGGLGMSKTAPISYAVQAAMAKATYELATFLTQRPWRGSVITVRDNILVINAGGDRGIERNMVLSILHKGEDLIDPETGLNIGASTEVIGTARITKVQPAFAEAAILDGCEGVKRGDRVEILQTAVLPPPTSKPTLAKDEGKIETSGSAASKAGS